jgi:hypothetical protein
MSATHRVLVVSALLVLAAGCAQRPRVRTTITPGTDFSKYRTYAIKPGNIVYPGTSPESRRDLEQRIQGAVAAELEGRGLVPQPDQPDLIVTYTASAQQVNGGGSGGGPSVAALPEGVDVRGGGGGYDEPGLVRPREGDDPGVTSESRRRYREGNLVIDLLDGQTRRLVWRATSSEVELASDRNSRLLDSVVRQAFEGLNLGTTADTHGRDATSRPAAATRPATTP